MSKERFNHAKSAFEISLKSWWSILKRIFSSVQKDNIPLIAAGVAFYCLLAIFPLLGATIALYGLMVSPQELQSHMTFLVNVVPTDSRYIIEEQLTNLIEKSNSTLGLLKRVTLPIVNRKAGAFLKTYWLALPALFS